MAAVVSDPKAEAVRREWIDKAPALGVPTDAVVGDLTF
jgi:hypothetical protein